MGMCDDLCLCTGHVGPTRVLNKPFSRLPTRRSIALSYLPIN